MYKKNMVSDRASLVSRRISKQLICILFTLFLLLPFVSAEKFFLVSVGVDDVSASLTGFSVIDFNEYWEDSFIDGDYQDFDGLEVELISGSGVGLGKSYAYPGEVLLDYIEGVAGVRLLKDGVEEDSMSLLFCNDNGICEPCYGVGCMLIENALTCSDCSPSASDFFCNTVDDDICDPDCGTSDADLDCAEFSDYLGAEEDSSLTCDEHQGSVCEFDDDCIGGFFIETYDSYFCCLGGTCGDVDSYIAVTTALQNQPSLTITEDGTQASTIIEYGIADYCIDKMKGTFCSFDEHCDGKNTEYYPGSFCCIGACVQYTPEEFGNTPEQIAAAGEAAMSPLTEEEIEELYAGEYYESAEDVPPVEEPVDDRFDDYLPPDGTVDDTRDLEDFVEVIEEVAGKVDWITVTLIALGVLFVVFILLGLFRRSASRKLSAETRQAVPMPDIQTEINMLIQKGFRYGQIQQKLIKRGFEKKVVAEAIQLNYQMRVARRAGSKKR